MVVTFDDDDDVIKSAINMARIKPAVREPNSMPFKNPGVDDMQRHQE